MAEPRPEDFGGTKVVRPEDFGGVKLARRKEDKRDVVEQATTRAGLEPAPELFRQFGKVGGESGQSVSKMAYDLGGRVTDVGAAVGLPPQLSALAGTVANVGAESAVGWAAGKAGSPALLERSRLLMQSALKPERAARLSGKADQAIETMLQKGINPTRGGMNRTQAIVDSLDDKVDDILKTSGATIDPNDVAIKTLKDSLSKITFHPDPTGQMKIIDDSINTFLSHPQVEGKGRITVEVANNLKKGITKALKDIQYGGGTSKLPMEIQAEKIRAANLAEANRIAEPKLVPTLKEQSELINAINVMEPTVSREGNKNLIGLGALSPSKEALAVWMMDRYPWFKSFVARTLYKGSEAIPAGATIGLLGTEQRNVKDK